MMQVIKSRLDDYEGDLRAINNDYKYLSQHIERLQNSKCCEELIDTMKDEFNEEIIRINNRINDMNYTVDTHSKSIQSLDKSLEKIDKLIQSNWQKI